MERPFTLERTNTILYCRHWQATVEFYRHQMGLPVLFENDWFAEFELTGDACLSIADAGRATIEAVAGQGITLTWRVADVEQVKQHLEQQGIETTEIKQRWGAPVFYCYDPEGHRLELWQAAEADSSDDPG